MFIREKPIRFGYKNWVIYFVDGYSVKLSPYQGKSDGEKDCSLGPKVVKELLEVVADTIKHDVYFDNSSTSLPLLEVLENVSLPATGTTRSNRAPGLPSPSNVEIA